MVSGTTILFGFTGHPIIEKSIGVKIVAGSGEAKGFEIEVEVKVEHVDLVEQFIVDPLRELRNTVVCQAVELDRFFVCVCHDTWHFLHAEPNGSSISGVAFDDDAVAVNDQRHIEANLRDDLDKQVDGLIVLPRIADIGLDLGDLLHHDLINNLHQCQPPFDTSEADAPDSRRSQRV